jgi:hypothetical protein
MPTPDHFTFMRNEAAYVDRAPDPQRECRACDNYTDKGSWKRCDKGGFFVRPSGTCRHFDAALVQSSPTDV